MVDYKKLGFRCGLEIHQQVDSGKLFCRCPSIVHDANPTIEIHRRLRAVAGESGNIDAAAMYEMTKSKAMVYEGCDTSACLVEIDEEPPHGMDQDAIGVAIQVAKLLNARIVDEVLVMRKIVVDGSNVSGFQRTALIAENGYVTTSRGKVSVPTICLEEESAQKIESTPHHVQYRLDRLGVPLIEIATGSEILDPEHAQEVAEKLGMILRSTGKVKRGIGTIRQDVNVSITGGARTEIKGFQELKSIPKVIDYEIKRQIDLLAQKRPIVPEVRKAEQDLTTSFLRPMPGAQRMYPETDVPSVSLPRSLIDGIPLPKLLDVQIGELTKTYHLDLDIANTLVSDGLGPWFVRLCKECVNLKPSYIADTLLSLERQAKAKAGADIHISDKDMETLLHAVNASQAPKEAAIDIIVVMHQEKQPIKEVLSRFKPLSENEIESRIKTIIAKNPGMPFNALIGKVMAVLRGKADGKKITEMTKKMAGL
ncbi:Glu-tRNA(Gln) amidotransferase subunit GatE [Candidatus Woesearchaeota archaeon]|nr:Glu-tRNA(Gln) amidotransferase subunit GatE [Candidatus Woesearchaeota archaeon]